MAEGAAATYVKPSAGETAETPLAVVTVTFTLPGRLVGARAQTCVPAAPKYSGKMLAAGVEPKSTAVAPARFVPLISTQVPPKTAPLAGAMLVTVAAGE